MAQLQQQSQDQVSSLSFESTPWLAAERVIEDPRRAPEPPLALADDDHVVELQAGDSIRLVR